MSAIWDDLDGNIAADLGSPSETADEDEASWLATMEPEDFAVLPPETLAELIEAFRELNDPAVDAELERLGFLGPPPDTKSPTT